MYECMCHSNVENGQNISNVRCFSDWFPFNVIHKVRNKSDSFVNKRLLTNANRSDWRRNDNLTKR